MALDGVSHTDPTHNVHPTSFVRCIERSGDEGMDDSDQVFVRADEEGGYRVSAGQARRRAHAIGKKCLPYATAARCPTNRERRQSAAEGFR